MSSRLIKWLWKFRGRYRRASAILRRIAHIAAPRGCELGVRRAELSAILLEERPDLTLVMVDSWEGEGRAYAVKEGETIASLSDEEQDRNYRTSLAATGFATSRRQLCRMRTGAAATQFPDGHFDFVFIDADHSYEGCKADILAWRSKVKSGGWLCGHDYENTRHPEFGVKRAVDEYCDQAGLVLETGANFTWFARIPAAKRTGIPPA